MPEQKQLTIVYEKAGSKPTIAVSGATGGISPDATSVVAHIYVESGSVPSFETHKIGPDGRINLANPDTTSRGDITREVQATLVMSPEASISIGQWMIQVGGAAMERRGGAGDD